MFQRILTTLFAFVMAVVLVALAVANRRIVEFVLDPFNPQAPALSISMPFFYYLFASLIVGVLLGGFAVWFAQGKWRRVARQRTQEALKWRSEVERLTRERDDHVSAAKKLASSTPTSDRQLAIAGR